MKKILSLILLAMLPLVANAETIEIDGIYYSFSNPGSDAMVSYCSRTYSGSVVILSSVTYDGETHTVTEIGNDAFSGCIGLTSITIPNSVTNIGNSTFYECYFAFDSFVNNSSLTSDDNWGAILCDEETGDGLLIIGGDLVKCRPWATDVSIPNSVTNISYSAFHGCSGLTSVSIPNSVTSIGEAAFSECIGLTFVTIECPNIGSWFSGLSSIEDITLGEKVTSIDDNAFKNCSGLTSIVIGNSVTNIGGFAFSGCSGLTSVTIQNSVTSIGDMAFSGCSGLTSVTIGNGVAYIGFEAFCGCSNLTSVTIGKGVAYINWQAFCGCSNLTDVYCYATEPPYADGSFDFEYIEGHTILHVPESSIDVYRTTEPWNIFKEIVVLTDDDPTPDPDAIEDVKRENVSEVGYFDLNGYKLNKPQKGINIIRYSDGTTRKVLKKMKE